MRSFFTFVAIVACAIGCPFAVLATDQESVGAERPSGESPPDTTAAEQSSSATARSEEKPEVLSTSPSGAVRLEQISQDIWVVSTKDPAQRAKLPTPKESEDMSSDDEFHFSPNDEWIFGLRHVGSGLRDSHLYHRVSANKIDISESFNDKAWSNSVKLGVEKKNYSAAGAYAMTSFGCWSIDSARLLMSVSGGEEKRQMKGRYLYFNTRTNKFEVTDYVRKLNKTDFDGLACAEPLDPLLPETELKKRADELDQELNKVYRERTQATPQGQTSYLRDTQRTWLKWRDDGLKFYLASTPPGEHERRRLQFLGDVTAARIEELRTAEEEL